MESLIDLANHIGFDAIDQEISVWIEAGEFDESVLERARWIENRKEDDPGLVYLDELHRLMHPNGPYGREFCGHCK